MPRLRPLCEALHVPNQANALKLGKWSRRLGVPPKSKERGAVQGPKSPEPSSAARLGWDVFLLVCWGLRNGEKPLRSLLRGASWSWEEPCRAPQTTNEYPRAHAKFTKLGEDLDLGTLGPETSSWLPEHLPLRECGHATIHLHRHLHDPVGQEVPFEFLGLAPPAQKCNHQLACPQDVLAQSEQAFHVLNVDCQLNRGEMTDYMFSECSARD